MSHHKRCGFCGLPRHGTRNGYTRCIGRHWRLARELGIPEDEADPQREDESREEDRWAGFPYREPGSSLARAAGRLYRAGASPLSLSPDEDPAMTNPNDGASENEETKPAADGDGGEAGAAAAASEEAGEKPAEAAAEGEPGS